MFLFRMAIAPAVYILFHFLILTSALSISRPLSPEVSRFIPACAERCVLSFIDVSFTGLGCGPNFSLECLCSTRGKSQFTLGEAAVQCITAENQFGSCSVEEVNQRLTDTAYFMCQGQDGAIEPTHTLITASLLLPTASGDFVSFPPLKTTSADPDIPRPTADPTTLITGTRPPPPRPSLTTFTRPDPTASEGTSTEPPEERTSSATTTGDATSSTDTGSPPPPAETGAEEDNENEDEESPSLNTGQVAGISVGVAAAAAVAIGAVFLARYCRRKRHPGVKTGFLPRRSTWGYLSNNGGSESGGDDGETGQRNTLWPRGGPNNPIHDAPVQAVPPPAYTRQSTQQSRADPGPETIGLALSPPFKRDPAPQSPSARRISKLLPAKPIMPPLFARLASSPQELPESSFHNEGPPQLPPLTGFMTKQGSSPNQGYMQNSPKAQDTQQSFAVKENVGQSPPRKEEKQLPPVPLTLQIPQLGTVTAADGISRARESTATEFEEDSCLSPEGQIWRPPSSAPMSAAPTYVSDKNGNWILADAQPTESPEPKTAHPSGTMVPIFPPPAAASRSSLSQGRAAQRPSYTAAANVPRSQAAASSLYSQLSPTPRPLFYNSLNEQRQSSSASQTSRPPMDRASSRSSDITLFESSSDESKEPTPPEVRRTLTPVVESPRQESTRSPVPYPPIPGRARNSRQAGPPPRRPPVYYPPGQPSPTLGTMYHQPQPSGQGLSSYNVPSRGRRPAENPSNVRSGSPPTLRVVEPSPEPDDRGRLPSAHRPPSFNRPPAHMQPTYNRTRPPMPQQHQYRQYPLQAQGGPYPRMHDPNRFAPHSLNATGRPRPETNPSPTVAQHPTRASDDYEPFALRQTRPYPSQRPNLRSGPQQPFPLQTNMSAAPPGLNTFASPVSEASTSSSLLAKRLGSDKAAQMAIPTEQAQPKWNRGGPSTPNQGHHLPRTPGWQPKLTPTRRGDDLFLNVQ